MANPFSIRLDEDTVERLTRRAGLAGQPPRTVAQRYVEEGLRQDEHPLIRFVDRPTGRVACLAGSRMGVWEVVMVLRANDDDIEGTAEQLDLPAHLMDAALAYYGAFRGEIDDLVAASERAFIEGRAASVAGRAAAGA